MALMKHKNQFNLIKLADQQKTLRLSVPLVEMPNLASAVEPGTDEAATIELGFDRDSRGYRTITGKISISVQLICQRCNQVMDCPLLIEPHLAIVQSDKEAKDLPAEHDPCMIDGDLYPIAQLVEEEVLLALPIVPKHNNNQCY
jgi:uncharacterized protein